MIWAGWLWSTSGNAMAISSRANAVCSPAARRQVNAAGAGVLEAVRQFEFGQGVEGGEKALERLKPCPAIVAPPQVGFHLRADVGFEGVVQVFVEGWVGEVGHGWFVG